MKTDRKSTLNSILAKIVKADAKIKIEDVSPNGDVVFSASLGDFRITNSDICHPIMRTKFFVNFAGELLVRNNVDTFTKILTGFDPKLYDKIICNCKHTDFGMCVDSQSKVAKWQMHISLVQQILTEDYERIIENMPKSSRPPEESLADDQDSVGGDDESSEEEPG